MNIEKYKRREIELQERQQLIDVGKWGVEKVLDVITSPAIALVGGFALTNYAQNKVIGYTTTDNKTYNFNWWNAVFPQWSLFIPDFTEQNIPAGNPMTILTPDQANLARAALVALASSGLVGNIAGILKGAIK